VLVHFPSSLCSVIVASLTYVRENVPVCWLRLSSGETSPTLSSVLSVYVVAGDATLSMVLSRVELCVSLSLSRCSDLCPNVLHPSAVSRPRAMAGVCLCLVRETNTALFCVLWFTLLLP
jgi:hypothetical protein